MKSVWASCGVLLLVVLLVLGNGFYVNRTVQHMTELANALPFSPDSDTEAQLGEIIQLLNSHEASLGLSISFPLIDLVQELANSARAYAVAGDEAGYASSRAMLIDAIGDLNRLEKISVKNIM
jgi:predicted PurR-regulated permease PerM